MQGKLSPRSFVRYDCCTPPEPLYFREGILNSFADDDVRARFLNKFYQCLLAFQMPHKVRKLVVVGPKDSGKTSWSNIFHRVIPPGYVASLAKEKQFSAAMIKNDTQLVLVDEWSASTMQSDLVKCILQGGWMVAAVKHGLPRTVLNNSPYYITTNNLPTFGKEEDENVQRRIEVFRTKSLPQTLPGIDRWIYDHGMDCIAWIASEIDKYRDQIDPNELWYEPNNLGPLTMLPNEGQSLFSEEQIRGISTKHFKIILYVGLIITCVSPLIWRRVTWLSELKTIDRKPFILYALFNSFSWLTPPYNKSLALRFIITPINSDLTGN